LLFISAWVHTIIGEENGKRQSEIGGDKRRDGKQDDRIGMN
jgi:hypothetical protein